MTGLAACATSASTAPASPAPNAAELEQLRLDALNSYDVLDTPREESFDRLTRMIRTALDVSISTISIIDGHRMWFKSSDGFDGGESPRNTSICDQAIRQCAPLIIPDTFADPRVCDNVHVISGAKVRFYAGVPLKTPGGQHLGMVCALDTRPRTLSTEQIALLRDFAAIAMNELELRRIAAVDVLTGVMSRRAFKEEAARAFSLARRHRHEVSCIMLDLDKFKAVNDYHGHPVGDRVLSAVTAECQGRLRGSDLFGRLGGEEFAILLPHTGRAEALKVADKLRRAIARLRIETALEPIAVTASFGVAVADRSVTDLDALLARADEALYQAKDAGRDRCVLWASPVEAPQIGMRRRVLKAGRISFHGGRSSIDCSVRWLSDTGAGLNVITTAGIPQKFKLRIEADDFSRTCRVVTQKDDRHFEVMFEG